MDIKNLWIGDLLRVLETGVVGTFEGMDKDLLKLKVAEKIQYFSPLEIELAPDLDHEEFVEETLDIKSEQSVPKFNNTIDLHLEELPEFEASKWPFPVDYQAYKCRLFVEEAIAEKASGITIIHGVGTGVLKAAVLEVLDRYPEVKECTSIQNGGATLVSL